MLTLTLCLVLMVAFAFGNPDRKRGTQLLLIWCCLVQGNGPGQLSSSARLEQRNRTMFRQALRRLVPVGNVVAQQMQRNFGASAVTAAQQKGSLDPIQQLFVDKIREYRTKSAGGKLVDATPQTEATLKDMMENLERVYGAKGIDMTQFPTLSFSEPDLVWPGLSEDMLKLDPDAVRAQLLAEEQAEKEKEEDIDPMDI